MRRFARHAFTILCALSLLLCVAVGALWAGGGVRQVQVHHARWSQLYDCRTLSFTAGSGRTAMSFEFSDTQLDPAFPHIEHFRLFQPPGFDWDAVSMDESWLSSPIPHGGFDARHTIDTGRPGYRSERWTLAVPYWLPMALLVVPPALWLKRFRRARRAKRLGLCPACGYDLRASPERCPECGAVAKLYTKRGASHRFRPK